MRIPTDDPAATLHALFPTLVYQAKLEQHLSFKEAFASGVDEFRFEIESGSSKHFAGEYHGRILLHQERTLRPFFDALADQVARYLRVLGMKAELFEMQCLKSWLVLCEPSKDDETAIIAHNHSCSDISWVYYVDVPEECSAIKFHAGQRLRTSPFESAFHFDWSNEEKSAVSTFNWWNSDTWSVHPNEGDLLLFPGHQLHSVDANHSKVTRVSVAGDIALSLREDLVDREFGRTASNHWLKLPLEPPS